MLLIVGPALWLPEEVNEGMAQGGCPQIWVWPVSDEEVGTSPGAVLQGHGGNFYNQVSRAEPGEGCKACFDKYKVPTCINRHCPWGLRPFWPFPCPP